jgi:hypothetical protein
MTSAAFSWSNLKKNLIKRLNISIDSNSRSAYEFEPIFGSMSLKPVQFESPKNHSNSQDVVFCLVLALNVDF